MEVIQQIAENIPGINQHKVLGEVAAFRAKENRFRKPFIWASVEQMSPTSWWNGICCDTELSKVAAGVLNLPPTSASVERSFSRHSNIHSAKRNRLTNERAAKLVYISHNLALGSEDAEIGAASHSVVEQSSDQPRPSTSKEPEMEPPLSPLVDSESDAELEFSDSDESLYSLTSNLQPTSH